MSYYGDVLSVNRKHKYPKNLIYIFGTINLNNKRQFVQ
jgi:hypothetical protein